MEPGIAAVGLPCNPRKEMADRDFYAAPMLRHVEVAAEIKHIGFAAWQGCQQLQIVKLPPSVISGPGLCPVQPKSLRRVLLTQQSGHRQ